LGPKFKGSYKIVKVTESKNYKVQDSTGELIDGSYQRHKIKVIDNKSKQTESNSYVVEKSLNHRIVNGQTEYFVKWKGYPDSENS
jgi:hypothetical protein